MPRRIEHGSSAMACRIHAASQEAEAADRAASSIAREEQEGPGGHTRAVSCRSVAEHRMRPVSLDTFSSCASHHAERETPATG